MNIKKKKYKKKRKHYLNELLSYLKLNEAEFSEAIAVNPTRVSNVLNFKKVLSSSLANKIIAKYENISFDWLKDEIEPMIKEEQNIDLLNSANE
jgi:plasmid maintenance system antidote protein VapI